MSAYATTNNVFVDPKSENSTTLLLKPHVDSARIAETRCLLNNFCARLSLQMPKRSAGEPKALSNTPIVLKKRILGPNGPRIKVKAVQEIVVSI